MSNRGLIVMDTFAFRFRKFWVVLSLSGTNLLKGTGYKILMKNEFGFIVSQFVHSFGSWRSSAAVASPRESSTEFSTELRLSTTLSM